MQLAQRRLRSALAEFRYPKESDMTRLAHAVAHLTQAAVSLHRWRHKDQQACEEEYSKSQVQSPVPGGLSNETSQALRKALIGSSPFETEYSTLQEDMDGENEAIAPDSAAIGTREREM
jgi:hypothetical protein